AGAAGLPAFARLQFPGAGRPYRPGNPRLAPAEALGPLHCHPRPRIATSRRPACRGVSPSCLCSHHPGPRLELILGTAQEPGRLEWLAEAVGAGIEKPLRRAASEFHPADNRSRRSVTTL